MHTMNGYGLKSFPIPIVNKCLPCIATVKMLCLIMHDPMKAVLAQLQHAKRATLDKSILYTRPL